MGKEIIVVGAADIFDLARAAHGSQGGQVIGYCGLTRIMRSRYADFPYLGENLIDARRAHPGAVFVLALSNNRRRRELTAEVLSAGGEVASAIHPQSTIAESAHIGKGVIVQPHVIVAPAARVEEGTYLNYRAMVGHDVRIGAFAFIAPGAVLLGEADVGAEVFVGANAVVLPRIRIGDRARISAGAVVHSDVRPGATLVFEQKTRVLRGEV